MTALSNLYVEKVNSEHPLDVWMLNEKVDYISYITETNRQFETVGQWTKTNCTAANEIAPLDVPISGTNVSRISGSVPTLSTMNIDVVSVYTIPTTNFIASLANFAMAFNLYIDSPYATSISYGYRYTNTITSLTEEVSFTESFTSLDNATWRFFSNTFANPQAYVSNMKLFITISVTSGGGTGDYDFLINGLSFGQWSEEFNKKSVGISTSTIPTNIMLPGTLSVVEALSYGKSTKAYYLSKDYELFCKNFGIPLVYGSSNVTKIYPNSISSVDYPSLIFPGYGFLHESGKYNEYTAEMWIRINTDAPNPRRIFGPINSNDGIYVEDGFITLVLGKHYSSHYVGEWYRPMLINIRYIKNNISMLLNGEEVINIDFIEDDLVFPSDPTENWLGFYAYSDVHPISIDSFAIYSYSVPNEVAKRRWVWGQGVVAPETTNSALNATSIFNDYSFANYSVNYNYPDFAKWKQAFFNNVDTASSYLGIPNYSLPEFYTGTSTYSEWLDLLQAEQSIVTNKYYSFRPSISSPQQGYIFFKNFDILNEPIESFYAIFESDGSAVNEPLIKVVNSLTKDYLLISINGTTVTYSININGNSDITIPGQPPIPTETYFVKTVAANTLFSVGVDISKLSLLQIDGINKFFENVSSLSIYVAGDSQKTFSGKIYRVGFNAAYNHRNISSFYDSEGILNIDNTTANSLITHTANYTLNAYEKYGIFFLDIASSAYWEDYMPLSYFAKYIKDYNGVYYYDLDSLQINFDYPEPLETSSLQTSWTYLDLDTQYSGKTYADLDNSVSSTYSNYSDISSSTYSYYNTSNSAARVYVTFQQIISGANKNLIDYQYKVFPRTAAIVDPNFLTDIDETNTLIPGDWETRAFEIIDGTVIYPPTTYSNGNAVDFNSLAIVYHIDFKTEGINHHPIRFREFQIASQVLERQKFTEIGTRFGSTVYPYKKTGFYYDYKGKNPISTYKGSTPYLYTNRNSGWKIRGYFDNISERGISIPVNSQNGLDTKISSIQIWGRFSDIYLPQSDTVIFSVDHKNGIYDFYLVTDESSQRGLIYGINRSTGAPLTDVEYWINGQPVKTPYIVNEEWFVLGIAFTSLLDFSQYVGRINLNGPILYNNISYYLATNLDQQQQVQVRTWGQVKDSGTPIIWDYWQNSFTWANVRVISISNEYAINPAQVYEKYVGSERLIVDDNRDGILVNPDIVKVYSDISWSSTTKIPV